MTLTAETRGDQRHADVDRPRFFIDGDWVDPAGSETWQALEYQSIYTSARAARLCT